MAMCIGLNTGSLEHLIPEVSEEVSKYLQETVPIVTASYIRSMMYF